MQAYEVRNGAVAGLVATAPMSVAMKLMKEGLPWQQRYPLPPKQITERLSKKGWGKNLPEPVKTGATMLSHFAYGTGAGAAYAVVARKIKVSPFIKGTFFGVVVWAVSYLGWLPALGIMSPATKHPAQRNALMIAAHIVWGVVLALLVDRLDQTEQPSK